MRILDPRCSVGVDPGKFYPPTAEMQIAFALLAIFWWIAVWGLSDLLTHDWTNTEKFWYYIGLLVVVSLVVCVKPNIIRRF